MAFFLFLFRSLSRSIVCPSLVYGTHQLHQQDCCDIGHVWPFQGELSFSFPLSFHYLSLRSSVSLSIFIYISIKLFNYIYIYIYIYEMIIIRPNFLSLSPRVLLQHSGEMFHHLGHISWSMSTARGRHNLDSYLLSLDRFGFPFLSFFSFPMGPEVKSFRRMLLVSFAKSRRGAFSRSSYSRSVFLAEFDYQFFFSFLG